MNDSPVTAYSVQEHEFAHVVVVLFLELLPDITGVNNKEPQHTPPAPTYPHTGQLPTSSSTMTTCTSGVGASSLLAASATHTPQGVKPQRACATNEPQSAESKRTCFFKNERLARWATSLITCHPLVRIPIPPPDGDGVLGLLVVLLEMPRQVVLQLWRWRNMRAAVDPTQSLPPTSFAFSNRNPQLVQRGPSL